jgi:hypothetical protein
MQRNSSNSRNWRQRPTFAQLPFVQRDVQLFRETIPAKNGCRSHAFSACLRLVADR